MQILCNIILNKHMIFLKIIIISTAPDQPIRLYNLAYF